MKPAWQCVVIGGGAAGLSAALVLGRARRTVLVVDSGRQSNLPAGGIGGLLGHDGRRPSDFYAHAREELGRYPGIEIIGETVEDIEGGDGSFSVTFSDGSSSSSAKVVLAPGMDYEIEISEGGERLWGTSVFHCPFCHGWELRARPLAVKGRGERGVHGALLLRGWTEDVVLLTDGPSELADEDSARLQAAGVRVEEASIKRLLADGPNLLAVEFLDGSLLPREGLLISPLLRQRTDLPRRLNLDFAPPNPMFVDAIEVDAMQRTSVAGVFAAGDAAGGMPQVAAAIASGSMVGAAVVQSLLADEFGLPLPPVAAD